MSKERYLIIGLEKIAVATLPERGQVLVELQLPEELIGLADGLGLMAAFSPAEAREFAQRLIQMADDMEGR